MNPGKIFEHELKNSIQPDIFFYRIKDPAQSFGPGGQNTRFQPKNEFDCMMFKTPILIACELKQTKNTSISFSLEDNNKMIKKTQIESLLDVSKYENVFGGFLFNFRSKEQTFWIDINDFKDFYENTEKKQINIKDIEEHNGVLVPQKKKRTRYTYDIQFLWELYKSGET